MSVFRINKNNNYTVMSNHHFKERGMSLKAKGLLSLMLSLPDDWDYNVSGLVRLSKDGKDSVMTALAELEKHGYLVRRQLTNDKGQFNGIEYNIFEEPQKELAIAAKPISANETTGKQNAEKPPQSITNSINHLDNQSLTELERDKGDEIYEILEEIADKELRELYTDYVLQRRENGSPLTPKGLHMLIARGFRLSDSNMAVHRAIVETAIINQWQNLYSPRDEEKRGRDGYLEERKRFYLGEG